MGLIPKLVPAGVLIVSALVTYPHAPLLGLVFMILAFGLVMIMFDEEIDDD